MRHQKSEEVLGGAGGLKSRARYHSESDQGRGLAVPRLETAETTAIAAGVAIEAPSTTLPLEERLAQYTAAVRQMVAASPWTEWSREQRRVYCQKALLDTSRQCLEVIRLYAPTEKWAVPPGAVREHVDSLLDHLASWERSGAPEDWRGAYAANLALRDALKEAALAARRVK